MAAQPAALTIAVSFTELVKPHLAVLQFDYNGAAGFLLDCRELPIDLLLLGYKGKENENRKNHQVNDSLKYCGATRSQREHTDQQCECQQQFLFRSNA